VQSQRLDPELPRLSDRFSGHLRKILKGEEEEVHVRYPHFIQRTRQHDVRTVPLVKKYRLVYDKRQQVHEYNTLPYGY
jgi:hypothetical protein